MTESTLTGIEEHLLNESAVNNWKDLIKGNTTDLSTNSIYMNAKRCVDLITQIGIEVANSLDISNRIIEFQNILTDINRIDWNIFSIDFI